MSGRHRRSGPAAGVKVLGTFLVITLCIGGGWVLLRQLNKPSCVGEARLTVAAAPEIAPAVQATATEWVTEASGPNNRCVTVEVLSAAAPDVAAAIAGAKGGAINGVGGASGATRIPDVWIPDSSVWQQRVLAVSPEAVPTESPSVAGSPVVVAMPEPLAKLFGWPTEKLTWTGLLQRMTTGGTPLQVGIVEPNRDSAGLSGLLALGKAATGAGSRSQQATVAVLRALVQGRSAVVDDLLARFPRSTDPAVMASSLNAAPLPEQAVLAFNAKDPPVRLAALYLEPAPLPLDYPWVVLPTASGDTTALAEQFKRAIDGSAFTERLAGSGLRAADGSTGPGFASLTGAPVKTEPTPAPAAADVNRTLTTWNAVALPSRMLAVIDVSGSMLARVPTAGNATRAQVTVEASRQGLALFDDSWAVGVWTFSTLLDGNRDYRELVPIGPLSTNRGQLLGALGQIKPKPGGQTGLYDTVLAAYRRVQTDWDPGRINSIVLMTDGQNQDSNGVPLPKLLTELKKIVDPKRPIQVIIIGIGPEVDRAELQQITKATGGGVFIASDPSKIGEIFLQAIALRAAR